MAIDQVVFLILVILLCAGVFFSLLAGLAGFLKGIYKTGVKVLVKTILLIVAIFLAVPIANLISGREIDALNSLWQSVGQTSADLNPPTLQNFVSSYLLLVTDISPRNGISVYQRCWNLAGSLIAIVVFFLERILIQIFISLVTAIVYNGIFRWIIPAETPKQWKIRRKEKKKNSLTSGISNEDGSASERKTKRRLPLLRLPGALLGSVQEFVYFRIILSPLTGLCRMAIENKAVVNQFVSDRDTKKKRNNVRDAISSSAVYKINGLGNRDRVIRNKATEFESAGGVKISLVGLVDSAFDVAKPLLDANALSYDAAGTLVINYSALLSTGTVGQLLTRLAANPQVMALIPPLAEAAVSSLTGTNFPVQELSRKDIAWKDDINIFSGIYQSRYQYIIEPRITSDTSIDPGKIFLDPSKRTDEDIDTISSSIGNLGKRTLFKNNRSVILAYAGRYAQKNGISILPSDSEKYKSLDWSSELTIFTKNVLKLARSLSLSFSASTDWNSIPDTLRESFSDPVKRKVIRSSILGDENNAGILDRGIFDLVSIPETRSSLVSFIPGRSKYSKQIDFHTLLGNFDKTQEKNEIGKRFDIREILFDPDSPIDIKDLKTIDLTDDKTCETLCLLFEKAEESVLFSKLLPLVSKAFFFNSGFDFSQYRFSLNPYCFNYDDPDFRENREQVLLLRPKIATMVQKRNDSSLSNEQKVSYIDTDALRQLLSIVRNSQFFNSDKETGIASDAQKNANLHYFLKSLFSSSIFQNFPLSAPSLSERSSITWGEGKQGDGGEIDRICTVIESAKKNAKFRFGKEKKISDIQDFDAVGSLISNGRESEIIRPCALQIIDQSLNSYFTKLGIPLSLNQRRTERWKDDSDNIANILRLLKGTDRDDFDLSSFDSDRLNALLCQRKDRNLIKIANSEDDPFGYELYKLITSQKARKDRGIDSTRDASLFRESSSDPWIGDKTKKTIDGKEYEIDTSGRIYFLCKRRKARQEVGMDNLTNGNIPKGFIKNANLQESFSSPFIRKVFVSFIQSTLFHIDLSSLAISDGDIFDFSLRKKREKDEFVKTLDFIDFLYTLSTDKIDGKDKLSVRFENPFAWQETMAYPEVTDTDSPNYGKTFLDVFNERVDGRTSLSLFTARKEGSLLSPVSYFLEKTRKERNLSSLRTRGQGDSGLDALFASLVKDDYVVEGTYCKSLALDRQGRADDSTLSRKGLSKDKALSRRTRRNKSKIFHRVPISLRKQGFEDAGLASYLYDPDTKKTINGPSFFVHLTTGKDDVDFWQKEIGYGVERLLGDGELLSLLDKGSSLSDAKREDINLSFLYYLGNREIFKESRSYLFYNLIDRLTKDALKGTGKSLSLFALSTSSPYGESVKAYRREELLFSNPKLLGADQKLDEQKTKDDLARVKSLLVSVLDQLSCLVDGSKIDQIKFDFEQSTLICLRDDNGSLYRSDRASEIFAGAMNAFRENEKVTALIGPSVSSYDFYASDHYLVNPKEGLALNGLLVLLKTVPSRQSTSSGSLPYYTKKQLETFYPLFGKDNPYPNDIRYSTFYQDGVNSSFANAFQNKIFALPVLTKASLISTFNEVVSIDLTDNSVSELLEKAEIQ